MMAAAVVVVAAVAIEAGKEVEVDIVYHHVCCPKIPL
jgi:hypothetical protein